MDRLAKLVAVALASLAGASYAGYAQVSAPTGWTSTGGYGSFSAAANSSSFTNGVARASGTLNVGGRAVTMPAAFRLASNAPKFLAGRIGAGMALGMTSPLGIGLTLGAALLLPPMVDWLLTAKVRWNSDLNQWEKETTAGEYRWIDPNGEGSHISAAAACATIAPPGYTLTAKIASNGASASCENAQLGGSLGTVSRVLKQVVKYQAAPYDTVVKPLLETTPLPERLPDAIPLDWPVEDPIINPSPALAPQPMFVPQGSPQPVPNTNPQQYREPGVRVVPEPVPGSDPWRVSLTPEDKISTNPNGTPVTGPVTDTGSNPTNPTPETPDVGLCEQYPDILACQKLGELEPEKIKNTEVPLKIEKESGFPSGGQCPAPKVVQLMGQSFSFTIEPLCDFAKAIKPLFIGFAYLTAALTFLGVARRE